MAAVLEQLREDLRARRSLPPPEMRRALREAAGVSRHRLGTTLNVSRETIRLWETGDREPSGRNLRRYLAALELLAEEVRST